MTIDPIKKQQVAQLMGVKPEELLPGWEIFCVDPIIDEKKRPDWLEEFLKGAPELREAYEKGTAMFTISKDGWIQAHFTPDYYLDLAEKYPVDHGDPWPNAKQVRNLIRPNIDHNNPNTIRPNNDLAPELLEDAARKGREFREKMIRAGVIQPGEQGFIEGGKMVFRNPNPNGYNPELDRDHPHNRKWACQQAIAHEKLLSQVSDNARNQSDKAYQNPGLVDDQLIRSNRATQLSALSADPNTTMSEEMLIRMVYAIELGDANPRDIAYHRREYHLCKEAELARGELGSMRGEMALLKMQYKGYLYPDQTRQQAASLGPHN